LSLTQKSGKRGRFAKVPIQGIHPRAYAHGTLPVFVRWPGRPAVSLRASAIEIYLMRLRDDSHHRMGWKVYSDG
jgi:hypothetical protein